MLTTPANFTSEEEDSVRNVAQSLHVSWKKDVNLANQTFTIGVSIIGSGDIIGISPGAVGHPSNYRYFDESSYVTGMAWERSFNVPGGGLVKALAEADLTNDPEPDYGQSLFFDGTNDQVTFTRQTFTGPFTFACWVKNTAPSGVRFIYGDTLTDIKIGFSSNKLFVRVTSGGSSDNTINFADSDWHHLVFTRDTSNKVDVYVDGGSPQRLFSNVAQSGNCTIGYLGRTNIGQFLSGYLDDVMLWPTKLTDGQVSGLYTYRSVQPGATIIYGFDGVATDASGNGLDATLTGPVYSNLVSQRFMVGLKSGRFTPHYVGGNSELFTSILPRRPVIINAGFNYSGVNNLIPQFAGILTKQPEVSRRNSTVKLQAADYVDFFQNRFTDQQIMFTSERSDIVIENLLSDLGFSTAQYELDTGLNVIRFGLYETGTRFADIIHQIAQAEYGHFYQDEQGVFRFENRQHWSSPPHDTVARVIYTAQVIENEVPSDDHIINVVEIRGEPREVEDTQIIYEAQGYAGVGQVSLPAGGDTEIWLNYNDPIYRLDTPVPNGQADQTSFFAANTLEDGTGIDVSGAIYVKSMDNFAQSSKLVLHNNGVDDAFLVALTIYGRPARRTGDIYYRETYGSSITAYEERPFKIENPYIQETSWAQTLAGMILEDHAEPENLQQIRIRAIPSLQLGDLISWQGRSWRIYGIKTSLDPGTGFVQDLSLLQRDIISYFRIGVSTIGGTDEISP